jgi:hypothetical protein
MNNHTTLRLRKPYEYLLSMAEIGTLNAALRDIASEFKGQLQCSLVSFKSLAFGKRVEVFFLGYRPGYCGDESGITKLSWQKLTNDFVAALSALPDAKPHIREWSDQSKFDIRFSTHIAAKELIV